MARRVSKAAGFGSHIAALALVCLAAGLRAEDKKDAPRIIGIAPMDVVAGQATTLKLRGVKLDAVTEVRFPAVPGLKAEVKEKKKADLPTGLEAKEVGDTQVEIAFTLPADFSGEVLAVQAVTPAGETEPREIAVVANGLLTEEHEPNNGFAEAQLLERGKPVRGAIKEERDVDVFAFEAKQNETISVEVLAARRSSMLDPLLTLFDEKRRILRVVDDTSGRDPVLTFTAATAGKFYVVLQDAGDRGGAWHTYEIRLKEGR
jgi:hypothetical protein